jgi:hypothetical protein
MQWVVLFGEAFVVGTVGMAALFAFIGLELKCQEWAGKKFGAIGRIAVHVIATALVGAVFFTLVGMYESGVFSGLK